MSGRHDLTAWQAAFLADTRELSGQADRPIRLNERRHRNGRGHLVLVITVDTSGMITVPGGLALNQREQVEVHVPEDSSKPPAVVVGHDRFVGAPHVLYGRELCLYLDAAREWDPTGGATSFFNRLWDWLADAAAGRFSARDSLYHAIGGVPAGTEEAETLTLRDELPDRSALLWGVRRTRVRVDVQNQPVDGAAPVVFVPAAAAFPYGVGDTIGDLLDRFALNHDSLLSVVPRVLHSAACRSAAENGLYLLLGVPHPAGGAKHVAAAWIDAAGAKTLRSATASVQVIPLNWRRISDDRPAVATRRDVSTHASGFLGASITLYGCGAIGSWFAEFATRAGATRIVLADSALINRGLLVRQNYRESDVGRPKSDALADRLRAISDGLNVQQLIELDWTAAATAFTSADFIVDATANLAAAVSLQSLVQQFPSPDAVVAQIATDPTFGTHGLVTVRGTNDHRTLAEIDSEVGRIVVHDPTLEAYHGFWERAAPADQITPVRGCSIPTFRGSAADEAAVAALATSTLGRHRGLQLTGTHLFALPADSADTAPSRWIEPPSTSST
jgi:hypothetical protein